MTDTPAPNDMPDDEFESECAEAFKDLPRLSDEIKAMIKDRLAILSDHENDYAVKFIMMVFWHTIDSKPLPAPAVDLKELKRLTVVNVAKNTLMNDGGVYWIGKAIDHLAAQGMIKGVE